jgi:hypothetical protein
LLGENGTKATATNEPDSQPTQRFLGSNSEDSLPFKPFRQIRIASRGPLLIPTSFDFNMPRFTSAFHLPQAKVTTLQGFIENAGQESRTAGKSCKKAGVLSLMPVIHA